MPFARRASFLASEPGRVAPRLSAWGGFILLLSGGLAQAQVPSFSVTDPVRTTASSSYLWVPLTAPGSGGAFLTDGSDLLKSGKTINTSLQYDLVGTSAQAGFMIRYGTVGGVASVGFRMMVNGAPNLYTWAGVAGVGFDTTGDGNLDLLVYASSKSGQTGLYYQDPDPSFNSGNDAKMFATPVKISDLSATNFNYSTVTSTLYPGWSTVDLLADGMVSFIVPFATINTALVNAGVPTITTSSLIRMVGFTSTATDSINQDIFGATTVDATRFDASGGGFTEYTDVTGRPVPEPASAASVAASCLAGGFLWWRRRRSADAG